VASLLRNQNEILVTSVAPLAALPRRGEETIMVKAMEDEEEARKSLGTTYLRKEKKVTLKFMQEVIRTLSGQPSVDPTKPKSANSVKRKR
jgi:hypothetical protein